MPVDPCFSELLSDPRTTVQPPPPHVPLNKVRAVANAAMAQLDAPALPVQQDDHMTLEGHDIAFRHYRPSAAKTLPVIFFCHGGGFVWGDLNTHDGVCRRLAAETGFAVISLDYRLAPETRFPGPVEDVFGVVQRIVQQSERFGIDPDAVALCGDSAGAAICVSVAAMAVQTQVRLKHLSLIYPALDPSCGSASQQEFAAGPLLTKAAMAWFWDCYLGPTRQPTDVLVPSQITNFASFPPTTILTADCDPLRDEGEQFFVKMRKAGVDASYRCYPGMIHGFLSLPVRSPIIEAAFDDLCHRLAEMDTRING